MTGTKSLDDLYGLVADMPHVVAAALEPRFDGLDRRMDRLEGRMDGLEGRMGNIEIHMSNLESRTYKVEVNLQDLRQWMTQIGGRRRELKMTSKRYTPCSRS